MVTIAALTGACEEKSSLKTVASIEPSSPAPTESTDDTASSPTDTPTDLLGIDVSHHSGAVDWSAVRDAGYRFAFAKATEGVDESDSRFEEHWREMRANGLLRGAYHFYVTEDDPEQQARFFLSTVPFEDGDLLPVVDVELIGHGTEPGLVDRLRRFLDVVETELGVRPIIYTMPNFWDAHLGSGFESSPLWVAEYEVDSPRLPREWNEWLLWQYEGDASVPGVEKNADLSRLHPNANIDQLRIRRR